MLTPKLNHHSISCISDNTQYSQAIILMTISSLFVALSTLLGKWLTVSIALPMLVFLRFLVPALILWWTVLITNTCNIEIKNLKEHCLRALFVVLSQYALFYYLSHGSILNGTLFFMTSPLFVPLILRVTQKKYNPSLSMAKHLCWFYWGSVYIKTPSGYF